MIAYNGFRDDEKAFDGANPIFIGTADPEKSVPIGLLPRNVTIVHIEYRRPSLIL
jgi:hypothetical protein